VQKYATCVNLNSEATTTLTIHVYVVVPSLSGYYTQCGGESL